MLDNGKKLTYHWHIKLGAGQAGYPDKEVKGYFNSIIFLVLIKLLAWILQKYMPLAKLLALNFTL